MPFRRAGWLRRSLERQEAEAWIERLSISPADTTKLVTELSGGNAQKVVLARWLAVATGALLLAEPTAGVDIGAKSLIYTHLRAAAPKVCPSSSAPQMRWTSSSCATGCSSSPTERLKAELTGADINEDNIDHAVLSASEGNS